MAIFKLTPRRIVFLLIAAAIVTVLAYFWPRGEPLMLALQAIVDKNAGDRSLIADLILNNYREIRSNASLWSGVYWGFSFAAAILSAVAGLVLKLESLFKNEGARKDVAAACAVTAALLITVSTGGGFQDKWQTNRIASAELERLGYELLKNRDGDMQPYFTTIAAILHKRNMDLIGSKDEQP